MATTPTNPPKELSLLERLALKLSASQRDIAKTQAKLEQEAREAYELECRLKGLIDAVKRIGARIELADSQLQSRLRLIEARDESFLDTWGQSEMPNGPDYTQLVALKASIEDFPRARAQLIGKLEAAKKELADFERKHAL